MQEKGKTFAELRKIFGGEGKISIRRRLWKQAFNDNCKDNVKACIWLSKNYLGMADKIEDDRFKDLKPIIIRTSTEGEIKLSLEQKKEEEK
jgi:hypothetical protein